MTEEQFRRSKAAYIRELAESQGIADEIVDRLFLKRKVDDDLEGWRERDRACEGKDPFVRRQHLLACAVRRERESCLKGFLLVRLIRLRHNLLEIAEKTGISGRELFSWTWDAGSVPDEVQLEALMPHLQLRPAEQAHLRELREVALQRFVQPPPQRVESLSEYLKRVKTEGLGQALAALRGRKSKWSIEVFASQAAVTAELWLSWEQGRVMPDVQQLDAVLNKLYWIWLDGDSSDRADDEMWDAFNVDHYDDDDDTEWSRISSATPSVERDEAFRDADFKIFKTHDPALKMEIFKRSYEAFIRRTESSVGAYLHTLRKQQECTIEDMAWRAGVDDATWEAWEKDEILPSLLEVEELAHRLFVSEWRQNKLIEIRKGMAA